MRRIIIGIIVGLIIGITSTATAAYVYTASDIGYQPQDTNWSVSNASEALSSLKNDLNEVNTNVTEYKQQITEALADKGVSVDETSSMADITSGITNMGATDVYYLGDSKSIDIKTKYPSIDYTKLTANNFIVEATSGSASGSDSNDWSVSSVSGSASVSCGKSYNNTTGILTISCTVSVSASGGNARVNRSSNVSTKAYMVIGDIN